MRLYNIFFVERFGRNQSKLFASKKDMAEALCKTPAFKKRSLASMQAYVGQVLKPSGEPYSRPFSKKFKQALFGVISERLDEDTISFRELSERIEDGIRELKSDDSIIAGSDSALSEFWFRSKHAEELFIITHKPAESFNTQPSKKLTLTMAERAGIIPPTNSNDVKPAAYKFVILHDKNVADEFWINLYQSLSELEVIDLRKRLVESNKSSLKVFVWDPPFSYMPVCLFDPQSTNKSGFVIIHRDSERFSSGHDICELGPAELKKIVNEVYLPYFHNINRSDFFLNTPKKEGEIGPFLKEVTALSVLGGADV